MLDRGILIPDDEEVGIERLCPVCHVNYLEDDEDVCFMCAKEREEKAAQSEEREDFSEEDLPAQDEDEDLDIIPLSELEDEESAQDEDEDDEYEGSKEPDDFDYDVDPDDFEDDEDEDEDDEYDEDEDL